MLLNEPLLFLAAASSAAASIDQPLPERSQNVQPLNNSCGEWWQAVAGDDCLTISEDFNLSPEAFIKMNPHLEGDCQKVKESDFYCVKVKDTTEGTL